MKTGNQEVSDFINLNENTQYRKRKYNYVSTYFDVFILIITGLIVFVANSRNEMLPIIGIGIIIVSLYLCFKVRRNKKLLLLFAIIAFINISIGITDCINRGVYVADWQLPLRGTEYNVYTAKSILLFMVILNVILDIRWLKKKSVNICFYKIKLHYNPIISLVGILSLFLILITGYNKDIISSQGYVSNSNPLYEYAIVIFAIVWLFSGNKKIINNILIFYGVSFIIYSLSFGDRSAAFMMLLLVFILYFEKKITIVKLVLFALIAIILSNFIGVIRTGVPLDFYTITKNLIERGFYSDTVSYSYYSGITISVLHHIDSNAPKYFFEFLKYQIVGFGINEFGSMAHFVRENYSELFNRAGGLYTSSFYAWFGYNGVILSAVIMGIIIRTTYSKVGSFALLYQILIIVLSLRWYLYNPTGLFRSVFVVGTILLLLSIGFNSLCKARVN